MQGRRAARPLDESERRRREDVDGRRDERLEITFEAGDMGIFWVQPSLGKQICQNF
jgi:hypothetical protein